MTPVQAFIVGCVAGFVLLSIVVESRRRSMVGAIFVYVDCRGCMAHDHRLKWIGVGEREEPGDDRADPKIVVRILKHNGVQESSADHDQGSETFFATDKSIQKLAPNLYMIYK